MKITIFTTALLLLAPSLAHPQPSTNLQIVPEVAQRDEGASHLEELWKRKGGGGKGGKGGSSSSGSSSGYILTPSSCHIPTASANTIHQQFNRQRQYLFQHRRCDQTGLRCTALVRRRQILRWRRDEPLYIWSPVATRHHASLPWCRRTVGIPWPLAIRRVQLSVQSSVYFPQSLGHQHDQRQHDYHEARREHRHPLLPDRSTCWTR